MATDRKKTRLEKQRTRSAKNRARRRDEGKPSNEDMARAVLDIAFTRYLRQGRHQDLMRIGAQVADRLHKIGFDREATDSAWIDLFDRYQRQWSLLRIRHPLEAVQGFEGDVRSQ